MLTFSSELSLISVHVLLWLTAPGLNA